MVTGHTANGVNFRKGTSSMDSQELRTKLTEYDSIVLVDRSGSMSNPAKGFTSRWEQAREITAGIAGLASKVDEDGITLISFGGAFKADRDVKDGITSTADVAALFENQSPGGTTPLHSALEAAFGKKFASGKKTIMFVITDGEPDNKDSVKNCILAATAKLNDASEIRILFLQVGDDRAAAGYLEGLDNHLDGAKFDIVNAIGFGEANTLTPEELFERAISDSH